MTSAETSTRGADYWLRLANFAALVMLVTEVVIAVLATWIRFGESFIGYYAPTKLVLMGKNPYEYDQIVAIIQQITGIGGNSPFYYPLWIVFPIFPLSTIPFQFARLVWLVLSIACAYLAVRLLARLLGDCAAPWHRWLIWFYAFFSFGWMTLRPEQIAFMLLLDFAVTLWAIERRHINIAAVSLALLLAKFNVTFLPFIAIALYAWQREKRIVLGTILTLGLLFTVSSIVTPGWWEPILAGRLPNGWNQGLVGYQVDGRRLTTTTSDFLLYNFGIPEALGWGVQAVLAVVALGLLIHWRGALLFTAVLALPLGLLVTPYAMQYDYALLAPSFFWIVSRISQVGGWRKASVILGLAFIPTILFWEGPISDALWIPVVLAILLLITAPPISQVNTASRQYA